MASNKSHAKFPMAEVYCVPIALDAFCLSPDICDVKRVDDVTYATRLAPITQPNYTGLRLDSQLIQHDVLDSVDLHNTRPAVQNPRVTDVGDPLHALRQNRIGVYLHWSLPLTYRGGSTTATGTENNASTDKADPAQPVFREVPNRWLIVRRLHDQTPKLLDSYESWVVESDRVWQIDEIDDKDTETSKTGQLIDYRPNSTVKIPDLEVDVSPFLAVDSNGIGAGNNIHRQAEVFLGKRSWTGPKGKAGKWTEPGPVLPSGGTRPSVSVMSSSNPYFADYTSHNANVFSLCDTFADDDLDNPQYLDTATASYCVVGWHQSKNADPIFNNDGSILRSLLKSLKLQLSKADSDEMMPSLDKPLGTGNARLLCHGTIKGVVWNRSKRPKISQADIVGKLFRKGMRMEPVSVGASPLDSLLAFVLAHTQDMDSQDSEILDAQGDLTAEKAAKTNLAHLAKDIKLIAGLLLAADDTFDSQIKAQDILTTSNFSSSSGGNEWHYKVQVDGSGQPATIPKNLMDSLSNYNSQQFRLDATLAALASARWDLWAEWWKLVSCFQDAT